jgi:hypothetical protein
MSDLHWPQDFRHLDIRGQPSFGGCKGFSELYVAKDGKWYEIIPLPKDHPGRGKIMTPREVKPLENPELLKVLGSADDYLAERKAAFEEAGLTACLDCGPSKLRYAS